MIDAAWLPSISNKTLTQNLLDTMTTQNTDNIHIDTALVKRLIAMQFPKWQSLPITRLESDGWDNRSFHLGREFVIRLPSAKEYALKVEKEQYFLPKLAPFLPLPIPTPVVMGKPSKEYPWNWSIYQWIEGETASVAIIDDLCEFATILGKFLGALYKIDTAGGPLAGPHNFYRGGPLKTYDLEAREAIAILSRDIDVSTVTDIWNIALSSHWQNAPVWVHGDMDARNLLVNHGRLSAVIDFGGLGIGDPSCDVAIAWTFFKDASRNAFRHTLKLDNATWKRGRGWALWKALIICAKLPGTNPLEIEKSQHVINEIIADYKKENMKNLGKK
jgi:aminoglycoside phosphotransferase (APT) family kinase protein